MYCADASAQREHNHEREDTIKFRKTWKVLSKAVVFQIILWYLAAFGRIILLNWWVSREMREKDFSFGGWSGSDVVKRISFVTGAYLGIMTIKLFALLVYRARWLKQMRQSTGSLILRRNPLRWLWMIPGQCLLDILLFVWAIYITDLNWLEQRELGPVEGHPGPLLLIAVMFFAVCVTIGVAVAACICVCVSWYRDRRGQENAQAR